MQNGRHYLSEVIDVDDDATMGAVAAAMADIGPYEGEGGGAEGERAKEGGTRLEAKMGKLSV